MQRQTRAATNLLAAWYKSKTEDCIFNRSFMLWDLSVSKLMFVSALFSADRSPGRLLL